MYSEVADGVPVQPPGGIQKATSGKPRRNCCRNPGSNLFKKLGVIHAKIPRPISRDYQAESYEIDKDKWNSRTFLEES